MPRRWQPNRVLSKVLTKAVLEMVRGGLRWRDVVAALNRSSLWHPSQRTVWTVGSLKRWLRLSQPETYEAIGNERQRQRAAKEAKAQAERRYNAGAPRTRSECLTAPRPCPWVGCRYHLALELGPNGQPLLDSTERRPWEMAETCALDVADRGQHTQTEVAQFFGVSRAAIHETEHRALEKLRALGHGKDKENDDQED